MRILNSVMGTRKITMQVRMTDVKPRLAGQNI